MPLLPQLFRGVQREQFTTEAEFDMRYADMKNFITALERYRRASRKAAEALQQVAPALAELTSSIKCLADSPEIPEKVQSIFARADKDVSDFQRSATYARIHQNLFTDMTSSKEQLSKDVERLHDRGRERKAAKEKADKAAKKQSDPKYRDAFLQARAVLDAKSFNFDGEYQSLTEQRAQRAPEILSSALNDVEAFVAALARTLTETRVRADAAVAGLSDKNSATAPTPNEWSEVRYTANAYSDNQRYSVVVPNTYPYDDLPAYGVSNVAHVPSPREESPPNSPDGARQSGAIHDTYSMLSFPSYRAEPQMATAYTPPVVNVPPVQQPSSPRVREPSPPPVRQPTAPPDSETVARPLYPSRTSKPTGTSTPLQGIPLTQPCDGDGVANGSSVPEALPSIYPKPVKLFTGEASACKDV